MSYPMQPRRLHSVELGVKTFLALVSCMDHSSFIHVERQRESGQVRVLFKVISCYQARSSPKSCKTLKVQFRRPASSLKVSGHCEPARLGVISSEATSSKRTKIGANSADCSKARLSSARMTSSGQDAEVGSSLQYWWSWDWRGISLSLPPERGPSPAWLPLDSAITCYLGR